MPQDEKGFSCALSWANTRLWLVADQTLTVDQSIGLWVLTQVGQPSRFDSLTCWLMGFGNLLTNALG